MMSLEAIRSIARSAGNLARKSGLVPLRIPEGMTRPSFRAEVIRDRHVPILGDYLPRGWYIDRVVLVDKMGVGDAGMSLSVAELAEWIKPGEYLAGIEEGQFQVVVAAMVKGPLPEGHRVTAGTGCHQDAMATLDRRNWYANIPSRAVEPARKMDH